MQNIIIVDKNDQEIGYGEKMDVHLKGTLHRAFSVFIFNSKGEMLLQKRASYKYHSPNLWTNTCCSHHLKNKNLHDCANQRLMEEMGMEAELFFQFKFSYYANLENDLSENEIDHVFFGISDDLPKINLKEVNEWKYVSLDEIEKNILSNPENYTEWFKIIINRVILHFKNNF